MEGASLLLPGLTQRSAPEKPARSANIPCMLSSKLTRARWRTRSRGLDSRHDGLHRKRHSFLGFSSGVERRLGLLAQRAPLCAQNLRSDAVVKCQPHSRKPQSQSTRAGANLGELRHLKLGLLLLELGAAGLGKQRLHADRELQEHTDR